jgi:3-oxoacyl-[acyl-carrier-protein] synthase-1
VTVPSHRSVRLAGLGLITPIGNDRAAVIESLRTGQHGLTEANWFPENYRLVHGAPHGFRLDSMNSVGWSWDLPYSFAHDVIRSLPPHGVYALCAIEQALAQARIDRSTLQDGRTGLFCASGGSPRLVRHHLNTMAESKGRRMHPMGIVSTIAGTLNFNLAAHYGIRGPVTGFSSACASSAQAIGYAFDEIRWGRQDRMIVVGAEDSTLESLFPFMGMRALSRESDPRLASCPFDVRRSGFVGAGGAVALILEADNTSTSNDATSSVEIAGWGQSADGFSVAQSEPSGAGLETAIRHALNDADIDVTALDYVNAHATSTPIGDAAEARALLRVLGDHRPPVSSTKGLTGHPLSMSGAMEAAFCALAIEDAFVPGNAHLEEPDPVCGDLNLPRTSQNTALRTTLSTSSGFGGTNVALILRKV